MHILERWVKACKGKCWFNTEDEAELRIEKLKLRYKSKFTPLVPYQCEFCQRFHLTTKVKQKEYITMGIN